VRGSSCERSWYEFGMTTDFIELQRGCLCVRSCLLHVAGKVGWVLLFVLCVHQAQCVT
jgi:hypothetical protein